VPQAVDRSLGGLINIKILAVEMKNPEKLVLLSFSRTAVFLYKRNGVGK